MTLAGADRKWRNRPPCLRLSGVSCALRRHDGAAGRGRSESVAVRPVRQGDRRITFDQPMTDERYRDRPLEGDSLASAAQSYFAQSEQIPSLVRLPPKSAMAIGLQAHPVPASPGRRRGPRAHPAQLDHPDWPMSPSSRFGEGEELTDPDLRSTTSSGASFTRRRKCGPPRIQLSAAAAAIRLCASCCAVSGEEREAWSATTGSQGRLRILFDPLPDYARGRIVMGRLTLVKILC